VTTDTGNEPQFERMEGTAANHCASCQSPIADTYYEAGGKVFCPPCKESVAASLAGSSGPARCAKAALLGSGAAVLSAAIWYGIVKLTGYELGIVAVVVGIAVGGAVKLGSEQRGGWAYQMLAVVLTYLAIATSYVPLLMESAVPPATDDAAAQGEPVAGNAEGQGTPIQPSLPVAVLVSLALPVLQVMDGGIIGLLIVGFALWEAWRINRRVPIVFSGPFRLQRVPAASPV
jgi:hypothetical protein